MPLLWHYKESDVAESDLFIAVTASESVNITVCILAKQLGSQTIARISNAEFINADENISFVDIGVDELISPEDLAVEILQLLDQSAFSNSYEFEDGALTMIGTKLGANVPFIGKTIKEAVSLFSMFILCLLQTKKRNSIYVILRGIPFLRRVILFFITLEEGVEEIKNYQEKVLSQ